MVAFFVIFTFVAFILADAVVQWVEVRRRERIRGGAGAAIPAMAFEGISVPRGLFLDSGHTWIGLEPSGRAKVGLDSFAQRLIGRIDQVDFPEKGREVRRGEKLFAIRQGDRTAVFNAPIDGVVTSVNKAITEDSSVLGEDPYLKGWICALSPSNLARNLRELFIAEEIKDWLKVEMERFKGFLASTPLQSPAMGEVLPDGGHATVGILESMDDEAWLTFTREFLHNPKD